MVVKETEVYREWINSLKDLAGRARIQVRVDRLVHGNPGNHRDLTQGISELKIDFGPGYRVYYTKRGNRPPDLARRRGQVDPTARYRKGHRIGQEVTGITKHAESCSKETGERQD